MSKERRVERYNDELEAVGGEGSSDEEIDFYGGEDDRELQRDLYKLTDKLTDNSSDESEDQRMQVDKKNNKILLNRTEYQDKPDYFSQPRSQEDFLKFKDTWDCVVLRVNRVPQMDYIREKTTGKGGKEYKSIFGERREFNKAMSTLFEETTKTNNALTYASQFDKTLSAQFWQKAIKYHTNDIHWKQKIEKPGKRLIHSMEWLHSDANSLGGPVALINGAAGGYGANTQMAVVESALYRQPGISIEIETYTKPDTRVAEWYVYRVIAHDKDNKVIKQCEFNIDGRRQWYNQAN